MGAPIREELVLADSFSQTFRNFDAAANAAINVAEEFQRTLNEFSEGFLDGLVNSLQDSRDELGRMANEADNVKDAYKGVEDIIRKTTGGIDDNTNAQDKFNESVRMSEKSAGNLMGTISKIAGAVGVVKLAENFIETSDEMSQITAKLNMINDGTRTTAQLQEEIYESAQRSRGSYLDTANLVARLGMNAGDAFKSNTEMLQFAENLNKAFTIAGASVQEQESVILQMSQALAGGVLQGQEFKAVLQNAPNIMQIIGEYIDADVAKLREMSAEGELTADVVVNAMLGATTQINKQFEQIPRTFGNIMTTTKNKLVSGMGDVFNEWSARLNEADLQNTIDGVSDALLDLAKVGGDALITIADGIVTIRDNWDSIGPVLEIASGALIAYKILNIDIAAAVKGAWAAVNWELAAVSAAIGIISFGVPALVDAIDDAIEESKKGWDYNLWTAPGGTTFGLGANGAELSKNEQYALSRVKELLYDENGKIRTNNSYNLSVVNKEWESLLGYSYREYIARTNAMEQDWKNKGQWYQEYYTKEPEFNYAENQEAFKNKSNWYELYYGTGMRLVRGEHIAQDSDWYAQTYGYGNKIEESVEEIKDNGVKVKGEVKLSDEDLKIFRDIAENRYIANVSLETLAPSVNVNVENNGQNMSEDDIASAVTKALETQISEHTAISHG